ncbi:hypothetical protein CEXT_792381 [Caerostris extrusa]|uniref:Uncharacterized protein n=1 Tax=Caerostris extrusa TaxID=172846 RepID=A0AAV4TCU4_CAEEX|nr:hypothetical protein CEXT_792381 [Caerostris extrusa]
MFIHNKPLNTNNTCNPVYADVKCKQRNGEPTPSGTESRPTFTKREGIRSDGQSNFRLSKAAYPGPCVRENKTLTDSRPCTRSGLCLWLLGVYCLRR